jgi:hypothetical protein
MHPARTASYARIECDCGVILHMTRAHVERAGLPTCGCGHQTRIAEVQHRQKAARREQRVITTPRRVRRAAVARPTPPAPAPAAPSRKSKANADTIYGRMSAFDKRMTDLLLKEKFAGHHPGGGTMPVHFEHNGTIITDEKTARSYLKELREGKR